MASQFRVNLGVYDGPIDLLLYLVRKHEVDLEGLSVAVVTRQYLEYVALLERLDVDAIADFLDVASQLIEIKSRSVLPHAEEEAPGEPAEGPRQDLVTRLLEFKRYRDAASMLDERGAQWRLRFPRLAGGARSPRRQGVTLEGVELWDLVSAFGRVMRERLEPDPPHSVTFDETPVQVFMRRVHARLTAEGRIAFTALFPELVHKSTLVGTFMAVLELVRRGCALADQPHPQGDIVLRPGPRPLPESLEDVPVQGAPALGAHAP